jgi:hypothetical protein
MFFFLIYQLVYTCNYVLIGLIFFIWGDWSKMPEHPPRRAPPRTRTTLLRAPRWQPLGGWRGPPLRHPPHHLDLGLAKVDPLWCHHCRMRRMRCSGRVMRGRRRIRMRMRSGRGTGRGLCRTFICEAPLGFRIDPYLLQTNWLLNPRDYGNLS